MILFALFTQIKTYAQSDFIRIVPTDDPIADYIKNNSDSQLIRYFNADKSDEVALQAIKYQMVLSDTRYQNGLSANDISRMKQELESFMDVVVRVNKLVESGKEISTAKSSVLQDIGFNNSPTRRVQTPGAKSTESQEYTISVQ